MANRSEKHPEIVTRSELPLNAEPPLELLRRSFITPTELFYVRNHGSIPELDTNEYRLAVNGMVQQEVPLSIDEIRENFSKGTVTATLQCAGNRRQGLMEVASIPGEEPWSAGAIGNAQWSGAPLREVLQTAGVKPEVQHAAFTGSDEIEMEGQRFGGSIPIEKAMNPEVLLA
jgi:sulfite oxidase